MWLPSDVVRAVEEVARFHYVAVADTRRWNEHKREGELRLLTGWAWTAKNGTAQRQGFKTITVAYRDAWYSLVQHRDAPRLRRTVLKVVEREVAA
jgi:hypothetical protein